MPRMRSGRSIWIGRRGSWQVEVADDRRPGRDRQEARMVVQVLPGHLQEFRRARERQRHRAGPAPRCGSRRTTSDTAHARRPRTARRTASRQNPWRAPSRATRSAASPTRASDPQDEVLELEIGERQLEATERLARRAGRHDPIGPIGHAAIDPQPQLCVRRHGLATPHALRHLRAIPSPGDATLALAASLFVVPRRVGQRVEVAPPGMPPGGIGDPPSSRSATVPSGATA